jgi:excisionase family DNA binding protein
MVCTATVYALINDGQLPALRIGRSLRVALEDVEYFEKARIGTPNQSRLDPSAE